MNTVFLIVQQGHGVLYPRKFKIWGFTIGKLIYFSILTILLGIFVHISFWGFEPTDASWIQTRNNLKFGALSFSLTYLSTFGLWRFYWYKKMFYGSEYNARIEFLQSGYSDAIIEKQINELMKKEILRGHYNI